MNEVIRPALNLLFFIFLQKHVTSAKKHEIAYSEQKFKKMCMKNI